MRCQVRPRFINPNTPTAHVTALSRFADISYDIEVMGYFASHRHSSYMQHHRDNVTSGIIVMPGEIIANQSCVDELYDHESLLAVNVIL